MDEEKKTIRAQIRRLRAQMTREEIGQRSLEIWQRVLESGAYRSYARKTAYPAFQKSAICGSFQ